MLPPPSGIDIANAIKYFSTTFLSKETIFLLQIHEICFFFFRKFELFPSIDLFFAWKTIVAVLKDVPSSPHQMIKDPSQDQQRMSNYPNLEYGNLYNCIAMLLDVAPNITYGLNSKFWFIFIFCENFDIFENVHQFSAFFSPIPSNSHQFLHLFRVFINLSHFLLGLSI